MAGITASVECLMGFDCEVFEGAGLETAPTKKQEREGREVSKNSLKEKICMRKQVSCR